MVPPNGPVVECDWSSGNSDGEAETSAAKTRTTPDECVTSTRGWNSAWRCCLRRNAWCQNTVDAERQLRAGVASCL